MTVFSKILIAATLLAMSCLTHDSAWAATVEYDLSIAQQDVNITGSPVAAMTINGGIPGPTLRFTEGDLARQLVLFC